MNNKDCVSTFIETAEKIVPAIKFFLKKINNTDGSANGNNYLPQSIEEGLPVESSGDKYDVSVFKSSAKK